MRKVTTFVVGLILFVSPAFLAAQTASTASVSGTVTDPTGAVLPGADVALTDTATNLGRSQLTNVAGQFVFVNVLPGLYKITVTMQGFRQAVVPSLKVDVAKSYTIPITLEVGAVAETVEVTAGIGVELQTSDSTVGNVLKGEALRYMPTPNRSAVALMTLQPLVMPYRGVGVNDNVGGQVAGARSDQSTFSIDGADATDNTVGTHPVKPSGIGVEPIIPVPIDSIDEFRVGTTNPNATFGRSSGGQFAFVTKRGGNEFHGSVYWYHQNDNLNANTWTRNRTGQRDPELKDNRYGFSAGGPVIKDKTFVFGHFEGRRFPQAADITRIVPSSTLRGGTLQFRDCALGFDAQGRCLGGNVISYPVATSTLCGPTNSNACDPRGVGLSPAVSALWGFLPSGNDATLGDTLNTVGFRSTSDASIKSEFAVLRLDHNFSDKWRFDGAFRYYRQDQRSTTQLDVGGLLPGNTLGVPASLAGVPVQPRFLVMGVTGQLTPRMTNEFRFSWQRNWWWLERVSPFPQVPGANAALQVAGHPLFGGLVSEPIDVHTQVARTQGVNDKVTQIVDNATWIKGRHTIQFGGSWRHLDLYHLRDDKVVGSLASIVAELDDATALSIPTTNRPPTCAAGGPTTNCLLAGDVTRWNRLYAGMLGLVDNVGVMIVRDGSLNAKPIGTPLEVDATIEAFEFYGSDTWRIGPSLTLTFGASYQWQTPPKEKEGRFTFLIDPATGGIVTTQRHLADRRGLALVGEVFNPTLGYMPLRQSSRSDIFDVDWSNFGPRLSAAWNPSFTGGGLGRLFGDRKTVFRGGYSVVFDRLNTVQSIVIPLLGVGFAQTINCFGLRTTGVCGVTSDPSNGWRVGVDGAIPLSVLSIPSVTAPIIPSAPFGEILSFQVDPDITIGRSHSADLTIQRELPGNMLIEIGYAGRWGQNLNQNVQISAVPYFMLDVPSGQTFAQAFDCVAEPLRGNLRPAYCAGGAGAGVVAQPWFENQIGAGGTALLAAIQAASFQDGQVSSLWTTIQFLRPAGPITNLQVLDIWMRTDGGRSNYHAGFISLRKRMSHGLAFDFNYTLSKALDQAGLIQNFIGTFSSPYDRDIDYGPAFFDRRHVVSSWASYDLPFGRGRRWSTDNWGDKLIGGWSLRSIFTANSGLALTVGQGAQAWGGDPLNFSVASGAIPIARPNFGNSVHSGVRPTSGPGSAGGGSGSGLSLFADPAAVFGNFRRIRISEDTRSPRGTMRGLPRWNLDFSVIKKTPVTENVSVLFSLDFLNVFNRVEFADPTLSLLDPSSFGVLSTQFNTPRSIQFGLRVEF